jgi:hypothetical protein
MLAFTAPMWTLTGCRSVPPYSIVDLNSLVETILLRTFPASFSYICALILNNLLLSQRKLRVLEGPRQSRF